MFSWGRQNDLKKGLVVSFGSVSPKALIAVAGLLKELCSTLYTSFGAPLCMPGTQSKSSNPIQNHLETELDRLCSIADTPPMT